MGPFFERELAWLKKEKKLGGYNFFIRGGGGVGQWEARIWSCDLRPNERPRKKSHGEGTYTQHTYTQRTDTVTYRPTRPRGAELVKIFVLFISTLMWQGSPPRGLQQPNGRCQNIVHAKNRWRWTQTGGLSSCTHRLNGCQSTEIRIFGWTIKIIKITLQPEN